jgi:HAE1 family hydrophobic/amphiphilic exporter-1
MELLPEFQQDVASLGKLWVRSNQGKVVPLNTVASFHEGVGPVTVNHSGQLPAVTVSFDLAQGVSLGSSLTDVERSAKDFLPPCVVGSFAGTA